MTTGAKPYISDLEHHYHRANTQLIAAHIGSIAEVYGANCNKLDNAARAAFCKALRICGNPGWEADGYTFDKRDVAVIESALMHPELHPENRSGMSAFMREIQEISASPFNYNYLLGRLKNSIAERQELMMRELKKQFRTAQADEKYYQKKIADVTFFRKQLLALNDSRIIEKNLHKHMAKRLGQIQAGTKHYPNSETANDEIKAEFDRKVHQLKELRTRQLQDALRDLEDIRYPRLNAAVKACREADPLKGDEAFKGLKAQFDILIRGTHEEMNLHREKFKEVVEQIKLRRQLIKPEELQIDSSEKAKQALTKIIGLYTDMLNGSQTGEERWNCLYNWTTENQDIINQLGMGDELIDLQWNPERSQEDCEAYIGQLLTKWSLKLQEKYLPVPAAGVVASSCSDGRTYSSLDTAACSSSSSSLSESVSSPISSSSGIQVSRTAPRSASDSALADGREPALPHPSYDAAYDGAAAPASRREASVSRTDSQPDVASEASSTGSKVAAWFRNFGRGCVAHFRSKPKPPLPEIEQIIIDQYEQLARIAYVPPAVEEIPVERAPVTGFLPRLQNAGKSFVKWLRTDESTARPVRKTAIDGEALRTAFARWKLAKQGLTWTDKDMVLKSMIGEPRDYRWPQARKELAGNLGYERYFRIEDKNIGDLIEHDPHRLPAYLRNQVIPFWRGLMTARLAGEQASDRPHPVVRERGPASPYAVSDADLTVV